MRHNYLRRHENLQDVGSWAVGRTDTAVLAQIMGTAPDCEQERLAMTPKDAMVLALGLTDFATGAAEEMFKAHYISGHAVISREDGKTIVHFYNGINLTRVVVQMASYDLLEFAKALMVEALDMLTASHLENSGI